MIDRRNPVILSEAKDLSTANGGVHRNGKRNFHGRDPSPSARLGMTAGGTQTRQGRLSYF